MADDKTELTEPELEALFAAARRDAPLPTEALVARMLADADAVQPRQAEVSATARGPGFLRQLLQALGGWTSVAGLATATLAGIWIGISPPEAVGDLASDFLIGDDAYLVDLVPGFDSLLTEG